MGENNYFGGPKENDQIIVASNWKGFNVYLDYQPRSCPGFRNRGSKLRGL